VTPDELAQQLFLIDYFMPCSAAEKRRRMEKLLAEVPTATAMEALEMWEQRRRSEENQESS
jgi:hypothetical protein